MVPVVCVHSKVHICIGGFHYIACSSLLLVIQWSEYLIEQFIMAIHEITYLQINVEHMKYHSHN